MLFLLLQVCRLDLNQRVMMMSSLGHNLLRLIDSPLVPLQFPQIITTPLRFRPPLCAIHPPQALLPLTPLRLSSALSPYILFF